VSALLRADTPEQIAQLVLSHVAQFGCRGLRLVWNQTDAAGRPATLNSIPDTTPSTAEATLIDRAVAIGAPSHAAASGAHLVASILELTGSSAVLLTEWPGSEFPAATRETPWLDFLELIAARLDSTLQFVRQRLATEGFEKAARLQRALYTIADVAGSSELDMPEMLRHMHEVVGELMYAENFLMALYNPERDTVRFIYFADTQDHRVVDPNHEYAASTIGNSLTLSVIRHARSAMGPSSELREQFGLASDVSRYGPESADWLGVPMLADGEARGAVAVQSYDPATHYTEEDRALLAFVAQHILTAVVRRQAHEELERRVEQRTRELTEQVRERQRGERLQAALFAIADLAGSDLDVYEMLRRIHAAVGELMYAKNFFIALYNAESETVQFTYRADEKDADITDPHVQIPVAKLRNSVTLALIRHGRPEMGTTRELRKRLAVPGGAAALRGANGGTPPEHVLGVPMVADGAVRGIVVVQSYDETTPFTAEDQTLLSYVAQHILTALVRKQAKAELEQRVEERTRELTVQVSERQRGERLQAALYKIADLASGGLEMSEMLRRLHAAVGELMYAENFFIVLYNRERDTARFIYFADTQDPSVIDPEEDIAASEMHGSLSMAVIRHGRSAMGPSWKLRDDFGIVLGERNFGPESADWLGVPMVTEREVRGAVVVQSYDAATRYTEDDRALLGFVAQHILTALQRRQAFAELEQRVAERTRELTIEVHERQRGEKLQSALYAIADLASSDLDMSEMLRRIHNAVGELMVAKNFYIVLYHAERKTLRFMYFADEMDPGMYDPELEIPVERMSNSLTLGLIRHGHIVMGTAQQVAERLQVPGGTGLGTPAQHFLGVPMLADGEVRGVMVVQTYDNSVRYEDEDGTLLSYVAQHVLTALVRKQAKAELEHEVEQRTRELTVEVRERRRGEKLQVALYKIADLASGGLEMHEMLRRLHAAVSELMYAENFFITLYNAQRNTMRFIYFADKLEPNLVDPEEEIPVAQLSGSLSMAVIRTGRSAMGPSARLREEFNIVLGPRNSGPDSADWLGVPMVADKEVRGTVVVQSYDAGTHYTEDDRALLSFVAQHILTALQRRQAFAELERRVAERTRELTIEVRERQRGEKLQTALYAIADLASGELDMNEMLRRIHASVGELMYAKNFFIALYGAERQTLRFIYHADEKDPGLVDPNEEIPVAKMRNSLTLGLIHHGEPVLGPSRQVREILKVPGDTGVGTPAKHFLGVPMIADGGVRGVVVVQSYDETIHFSEEDQVLLSYVAQHILTALARKQAKAELERRVEDRTRELADAVHELRSQISERERVEQQLLYENLHDALTGLPNRSFLLDSLARALARLRRDPAHRFAVLFLDLDRFKVVNDSVGHLVGDEMLKQAGERIGSCVRAPDVVARLGGDEFAILLDQIRGPEDSFHVAQRVIDAISQPMHIAGKELFPSASVGIALSHERYRSAEELLRDADVAMYRAKARGRQRFEVFDERLHQDALHLLNLESDLRRALLRSEFEPHFQSIVRLSDAHVVGCEALLRWRHPERGLLLPADFLSVAEENGSAEQIDWQMFDKTCHALPNVLKDGGYVTLNVSARHFRSPELARQILDMLVAHAIPPGRVRLEMTEGALFENPDQARQTLETLRHAGVFAALDDFGTGYSSLSYLHRFPLHAVKIDKSFVADLRPGTTGGSAAVVRAVLALASTLGMEVVAEGIETTEQRDHLIELGCTFGQGFLFSQPRPATNWATLH
jgi:diguanylate cyclase (GGDEF)-like protein